MTKGSSEKLCPEFNSSLRSTQTYSEVQPQTYQCGWRPTFRACRKVDSTVASILGVRLTVAPSFPYRPHGHAPQSTQRFPDRAFQDLPPIDPPIPRCDTIANHSHKSPSRSRSCPRYSSLEPVKESVLKPHW